MEITPYKELREKLRTGDVLVCQGNGWFSGLIRLATKGDQSHVGMILKIDELDRILVSESVESKGVRVIRLSKYLTDYDNKGNPYNGEIYILRHKSFETISMGTPEKVDAMITFAIDALGHPYSKRQIMKIIYNLFFKRAIAKLVANKRTEWICSVFVGDLFSVLGLIIPINGDGYLKPSDYVAGEDFELVGRLK